MTRPTWDATWLEFAITMAKRSRCPVGVGAVIVDDLQRVVATGYAGPPATWLARTDPPPFMTGSCREYCPRARLSHEEKSLSYVADGCYSVHAEVNALLFADRTRVEGGTLYVSSVPCLTCAPIVGNSGVRRVVWPASEADVHRDAEKTIAFLDECRLVVTVVR